MKSKIQEMKEEIKLLDAELYSKKETLNTLKTDLNKTESALYPLENFVGHLYTFDKPYKWQHPKKEIFSDVAPKRFNYLKFNGTYTGKELNYIYVDAGLEPELKFKDDSTYATFVIPDEDFYAELPNQVIPLDSIHELLSFEI